MANHSASEKAIRKTAKRSAVNKNRRTRVRTYIKKVVTAVEGLVSGVDAAAALITAQSEMMRAVAKGLIKKNTASRKISRLAKKVKAMAGVTKVAAPKKAAAKVEKVKAETVKKTKATKAPSETAAPKKKTTATTKKKVASAE